MTVANLKAQAQNLLGLPKPHLIFMHIPKTGGTSVDLSLKTVYGRKNSYKIDSILTSKAIKAVNRKNDYETGLDKFKLRESLLLYEMAKGTKYISGHFQFNPDIWEAYRHQYAWVTVLRDPVKRYISQYFFDAFKPDDHARVNESLEAFIESDRGKFRGQNYVNYFGNFPRGSTIDPMKRMKLAQENLSKFSVIGFLDDLDGFRSNLQQAFDLNVRISHANKNPVANPEILPDVRQKLEDICQYDMMLYTYAKENILSS